MTKEQIYDDQISPLMQQIIEICKANKIPLIASFGIDGEGENRDLLCSTAILTDGFNAPERFKEAWRLLRGGRSMTMLTTKNKEGEVTNMTAILA